MEQNKHPIDTSLVIAVDGQLNNEYMAEINSELRRQQLRQVGSIMISATKTAIIKTGRGALYAYAKAYDDFNHTNTRHEIFG